MGRARRRRPRSRPVRGSGVPRSAEREGLDFAIGSKRHPDSVVHYPRSRRVVSWLYQQLVRLLFGLDVRDTQVGLKVFRREVTDEVLPLLLVKRFAFDLELLAVSSSLGFSRIEEQPIDLQYRFTGSGVARSRSSARWSTPRRSSIGCGCCGHTSASGPCSEDEPGRGERSSRLFVPRRPASAQPGWIIRHSCSKRARHRPNSLPSSRPAVAPAGNWVSAAVSYFVRSDVAAVVAPSVTPADASLRERAAAAVLESRLGGGSRRSAYLPGNVGITADDAGGSLVVRRADWEHASKAGIPAAPGRVVARRAGEAHGLHAGHVRRRRAAALSFGLTCATRCDAAVGVARRRVRTRGRSLSAATLLSHPSARGRRGRLGVPAGRGSGRRAAPRRSGPAILASAALAALRFRSLRVGLLAVPALVLTQAAYLGGFVRRLVSGA